MISAKMPVRYFWVSLNMYLQFEDTVSSTKTVTNLKCYAQVFENI